METDQLYIQNIEYHKLYESSYKRRNKRVTFHYLTCMRFRDLLFSKYIVSRCMQEIGIDSSIWAVKDQNDKPVPANICCHVLWSV